MGGGGRKDGVQRGARGKEGAGLGGVERGQSSEAEGREANS